MNFFRGMYFGETESRIKILSRMNVTNTAEDRKNRLKIYIKTIINGRPEKSLRTKFVRNLKFKGHKNEYNWMARLV